MFRAIKQFWSDLEYKIWRFFNSRAVNQAEARAGIGLEQIRPGMSDKDMRKASTAILDAIHVRRPIPTDDDPAPCSAPFKFVPQPSSTTIPRLRTKSFWGQVQDKRAEIAEQLKSGKLSGQPVWLASNVFRDTLPEYLGCDGNSIYLISKVMPCVQITASGHVVEATVHLAGQRLIEGTHEIASSKQISKFKRAGEQLRKRALSVAKEEQAALNATRAMA